MTLENSMSIVQVIVIIMMMIVVAVIIVIYFIVNVRMLGSIGWYWRQTIRSRVQGELT